MAYLLCLYFVCVFYNLSAILVPGSSALSAFFMPCLLFMFCPLRLCSLWFVNYLCLIRFICIYYTYARFSVTLFASASAVPMPALFTLFVSVSISASTSISTLEFAIYCKSQPSIFTSSKELINLVLYLSRLYHSFYYPLYYPSL